MVVVKVSRGSVVVENSSSNVIGGGTRDAVETGGPLVRGVFPVSLGKFVFIYYE